MANINSAIGKSTVASEFGNFIKTILERERAKYGRT